jgi:hypothetical protein
LLFAKKKKREDAQSVHTNKTVALLKKEKTRKNMAEKGPTRLGRKRTQQEKKVNNW